MRIRMQVIVATLALVAGTCGSFATSGTRALMEEIKVGGPDGWDYTTFEPTTRTVYIAHGSAIASQMSERYHEHESNEP